MKYKKRKEMKRVVKSRQGYTATLTMVECKIRKMFAFPTAGKSPPLKIVDAFLECYKLQGGRNRYTRTDQGSKLSWMTNFREILLKHNCILEPTGLNAASENGLAERPNETIAHLKEGFCICRA